MSVHEMNTRANVHRMDKIRPASAIHLPTKAPSEAFILRMAIMQRLWTNTGNGKKAPHSSAAIARLEVFGFCA